MSTTQNKCHAGPCGPCSLCQQRRHRYTHAVKLTDEEYLLLVRVNSSTVKTDACICYNCVKQLKRNKENHNFHPRWKSNLPSLTEAKCSVHKCLKIVAKHMKLASTTEVENVLELRLDSFTVVGE